MFSGSDVLLLRSLVTATQQDHQGVTPLHEVDTIARTIIDAQFVDAVSDRFDVPGVAERKPANATLMRAFAFSSRKRLNQPA
jgi:hypothetical protein